MQYRFTVPIYANVSKKKQVLVGMNWYNGCNPFVSNKVKKFYEELIEEEFDGKAPLNPPYKITYHIYVMRSDTDGGNVRSVIEKFVLDALVSCGIFKEDTWDMVKRDEAEYFHDTENPRAVITIEEVNMDKDQLNLF